MSGKPEEKSKKWKLVPEGYVLKSDIAAICNAAVERFEGKSFGEFYVSFCKDMGKRATQYGDKLYISDKQKAILCKLEINNWPEGVKAPPPREPVSHDKDFDEFTVPF